MAFWTAKHLAVTAAALGTFVVGALPAQAAEKNLETAGAVELFAAVDAEQIGVRMIPKDATEATIIIENKTKQPITVRLPKAFVGMPVLAQNLGGGGGGGNNNSGGGNQTSGGGMGMMGGMGGGFFKVGPEKVGKFKLPTVCLEHGKKDPNPRVPYELKPVSEFTQDAKVVELLTLLGNRQLDQQSAQAAAWHITDGLTWQQLAEKIKVKHLNGSVEMYFNANQLQTAMQAVRFAQVQAASSQQVVADAIANSPGEAAEF